MYEHTRADIDALVAAIDKAQDLFGTRKYG